MNKLAIPVATSKANFSMTSLRSSLLMTVFYIAHLRHQKRKFVLFTVLFEPVAFLPLSELALSSS
jgi:hypothetical protein